MKEILKKKLDLLEKQEKQEKELWESIIKLLIQINWKH